MYGSYSFIPKPYLKTWDEDQWCRSLIRKLDQRHQGNSQLPYSWSMVQQLTKAIPERLHFTARNKNRNRKGAKYDTIEIVPKSTISRQGNENPSWNSLVESHTNSNNSHNENTDSNITTANNRNVTDVDADLPPIAISLLLVFIWLIKRWCLRCSPA
jgi:hypothetical protein